MFFLYEKDFKENSHKKTSEIKLMAFQQRNKKEKFSPEVQFFRAIS